MCIAALAANSLIFVAKITAWCACGGSALLAEAIHSLADIGNQALLRLGIAKAQRAPTPEYPYGYMRDKFVFRCAASRPISDAFGCDAWTTQIPVGSEV